MLNWLAGRLVTWLVGQQLEVASSQARRAQFANQAVRGRAADIAGRPEPSVIIVLCFGRVYWTTTGLR